MVFLRVALLVGDAADLFQDGQVAAKRVHGISLFQKDEILVVADELLVELPEGKVRNLEFRLDEFGKRAVGEEVGRECGGRTVHTDTGLHFPVMPVEKFEQGHLHARIALEHVPDRGGIEIPFSFHEGIEGRVYGKQQSFYFFIGLHRFPALAVQPALTRVPQPGGAGELAAELRHRAVEGDPSHDRGLAGLAQLALFQVEQYLEFFHFHTLFFRL